MELTDIHAVEETMVQSIPGSFMSSDALLNRIWQVGVDTLIPSMTDAYADPWRERGQWVGDAFAALHVNRVSVGDMGLWRRMLRQVSDGAAADGSLPPAAPLHGRGTAFLLDYSMLWLESLYRYWELTGDVALLRELLPTAHRSLEFARQFENEFGLLYLPPTATTDTGDGAISLSRLALIDWSAPTSRIGESAAVNALYSASLGWMAEMLTAVGDQQATAYAQRSQQVRATIHERLYLPESGAYATSRLNDTYIAPTPQAQAWPLTYDIVPREHQTTVLNAMLRLMDEATQTTGHPSVEIYGFFWVLNALGKHGRITDALNLIRTHYGNLLAQGATTWWEAFQSNQRYDASLTHAWGGAPTWFLSSYVLGAQILPHQQWRVAPQSGDVQHARGVFPLQASKVLTVTVDWQPTGCRPFQMTVQAPSDTRGYLIVPLGEAAAEVKVVVNNTAVWPRSINDGRYPVAVTAAGLQISVFGAARYNVHSLAGCPHIFLPYVKV